MSSGNSSVGGDNNRNEYARPHRPHLPLSTIQTLLRAYLKEGSVNKDDVLLSSILAALIRLPNDEPNFKYDRYITHIISLLLR
jgi:hypothetical protein